MVQMPCNEGIAHESDSGMLEQSMYTIKMGVLNSVCIALQVRWVGTMWKLWLHVALLCVMLVCVGLMTRGVNQVVSSMRGHLDMLMGHPWHHGRCGLLVLVLGHVAYLMHLDAVKTHTCRGCIPIVIEVMGGAVASTCAAA